MKQWISNYSIFWDEQGDPFYSPIGLLNIDTNNTIELMTFINTCGILRIDRACYYKVIGIYVSK